MKHIALLLCIAAIAHQTICMRTAAPIPVISPAASPELNTQQGTKQPSPLEIQQFVQSAWARNTNICLNLLKLYGKNIVNEKDSVGRTALHAAVEGAFINNDLRHDIFDILVTHGARPSSTKRVRGKECTVLEHIELLVQERQVRYSTDERFRANVDQIKSILTNSNPSYSNLLDQRPQGSSLPKENGIKDSNAHPEHARRVEPVQNGPSHAPSAQIDKFTSFAYRSMINQCQEMITQYGDTIVNSKDARGRTALHAAVEGAFALREELSPGIVELLLRNNANPDIPLSIDKKEYTVKQHIAYRIQKNSVRWNNVSAPANARWRSCIEDVCFPYLERQTPKPNQSQIIEKILYPNGQRGAASEPTNNDIHAPAPVAVALSPVNEPVNDRPSEPAHVSDEDSLQQADTSPPAVEPAAAEPVAPVSQLPEKSPKKSHKHKKEKKHASKSKHKHRSSGSGRSERSSNDESSPSTALMSKAAVMSFLRNHAKPLLGIFGVSSALFFWLLTKNMHAEQAKNIGNNS